MAPKNSDVVDLMEGRENSVSDVSVANGNWKVSLVFLSVYTITLLILFRSSFMSMVDIWQRSDTFAHGFLIPIISLWLIWRNRESLSKFSPQVSPIWCVPIFGSAFLWLLGVLANALVVEQLGVVLMLAFGVVMILGQSFGRQIAFPLVFLFLMVPMGEELIEPMMELTATSTVWLVRSIGIPVFREGLYFSLPSGNWSVVEACSGVRYLIASFALGTLYAYITYRTLYKRVLFVVFSILIPVIANSLRAFMIVLIGHYSDMQYAVGVDHLIYGWVFFGVVIFLMFWLGNFFADDMATDYRSDERVSQSIAGSFGVSSTAKTIAIGSIMLVSMGLVSQAPDWLLPKGADNSGLQLIYPEAESELQVDETHQSWKPSPVSPDFSKQSKYQFDDKVITVSQFHYLKHRDGGELVNSLERWTSDAQGDWRILQKGHQNILIGQKDLTVEYAVLSNGLESQLIWRWYRIDEYYSSDPYATKIRQILAIFDPTVKISGRYYLAVALDDSIELAQAVLENFVRQRSLKNVTLVGDEP